MKKKRKGKSNFSSSVHTAPLILLFKMPYQALGFVKEVLFSHH